MLQSTLNFDYIEKYNEDDYMISGHNSDAYAWMRSWPQKWGTDPYPSIVLLSGSNRSGKTHLAKLWQKRAEAVFLNLLDQNNKVLSSNLIIEDIELLAVQAKDLFHIFNIANERKISLLITSNLSAQMLDLGLPDLNSRLRAILEVKIQDPDDEMIKFILFKHFSKRSIKIDHKIIDYLCKILPRNFALIDQKIALLDKYSLTTKRSITIPLINKILLETQVLD